MTDGNAGPLLSVENLRVAFSVTVAGLLVGAVAYTISLVRNRIYDQDYSDVEYMAAALADVPTEAAPSPPPAGTPHVHAPQEAIVP